MQPDSFPLCGVIRYNVKVLDKNMKVPLCNNVNDAKGGDDSRSSMSFLGLNECDIQPPMVWRAFLHQFLSKRCNETSVGDGDRC